jgi:hypothetical protein
MQEPIVTAPDLTRGIVTVELSDAETGRIAYRETAENFVSNQSKAVARWFQRFMWGMFCPVETKNAAGYRPSEMPWFPADHIAYWNDATAENAATEVNVQKELVGWASRNPIGSNSGKRGVVNISESEFTDSYAKWVWDWTTAQGNGTFQSVGWTRVHETNGFPMARFPEEDLITVTHSGTYTSMAAALAWSASGSKWLMIDALQASPYSVRLVSVGTSGGASTVEVTLSGWASYQGTIKDVDVYGTNYFSCGFSPTNYPRLVKHDSTGAVIWTKDEGTQYAYHRGVTVDSSGKPWTAGSDGIMRRHSASDGTVELTITPALAPSALYGIAYDPADGHFWISGLFSGGVGIAKVDNSGGTVGPLFGLNANSYTVNSTVGNPDPPAGNYVVPASNGRDTFGFGRNVASASSSTGYSVIRTPSIANNLTTVSSYGLPLAIGPSGVLYAGLSANAGTKYISSLAGATLGTRVRLSSPVTKTNTQNLKVTYQFDFV